MGHGRIAETMDTYGHLFPVSEDSGRGALDRVLRATSEGSRGATAEQERSRTGKTAGQSTGGGRVGPSAGYRRGGVADLRKRRKVPLTCGDA